MSKTGIFQHERAYEGATNVWLTPKYIIDATGPYDLDPCAADPRPFDIGKHNFTEFEDGLSLPWDHDEDGHLFVFCNPPYGPHTGKWMKRMAKHRHGIALIFARTETEAMQECLKAADTVLFLAKRINFLKGTPPFEKGASSGAPSVLVAFGSLAVDRLYKIRDWGVLYGKPIVQQRFTPVILESPYGGDVERNVAYARECIGDCFRRGEAAYASHLLYPGTLDDNIPDQRNLGMEAGFEWIGRAHKTVVYTDYGISPGMEAGIERARALGRHVEYRSLNGKAT